MEQIHLPSTIEFQDTEKPNTGLVVVSPCHQGYGTTIGNALRRVLLSSLPGAAVESVRINGVQHEYATIEGVQEDVVQIILNLKQLALVSYTEEPVTISLSKKGKGTVTAADFEKNSDIEIVNTDAVVANITSDDTKLEMEIVIGRGRGYVPVSEKETKTLDLGTIAIDSLYTPIRDIGYNVELTRVGDVTNYERLELTIETNGTVTPKEAVCQATKILMDHFALIMDATGHSSGNVSDFVDSAEVDDDKAEEVEEKPKKKATKKKSASEKKEAEEETAE